MKAAGITFKHIWVLPDMQDESKACIQQYYARMYTFVHVATDNSLSVALEDGVLTFDSLKDNDGNAMLPMIAQ